MIPLKARGKIQNIFETKVVRVTKDLSKVDTYTYFLDESPFGELNIKGGGFLSTKKKENISENGIPGVFGILDLGHLEEGDIVSINPNGRIWTLFRINSFNNSLFVTERCNSNCLIVKFLDTQ